MAAFQGGDTDEGATNLLLEYVQRALLSRAAKGADPAPFHNFVKEFIALRKKVERNGSDERSCLMLANLIDALKNSVSVLKERKHDTILSEVLAIKMWSVAAIVRHAVLDFLGHLVVVNSAFTHTCLHMLVFNFLPPPVPPNPDAALQPWQPTLNLIDIQTSMLTTLVKIMALVPTAPGIVLSLATSSMPHKLRDRDTQCMFLHALFTIAEAPAGRGIRDNLLALVVEHLLSLDVDIKWEDITNAPSGLESEDESEQQAPSADMNNEAEVEDIFAVEGLREMDINAGPQAIELLRQQRATQAAATAAAAAALKASRGGWEGLASAARTAGPSSTAQASGPAGNGTQADAPAAAGRQQPDASTSGRDDTAPDATAVMANKMDCMMELTFQHLGRRCSQPGGLTGAWDVLLASYERSILHTHRCKFAQFLLFFLCFRFPEPCARLFIDFNLLRIVSDSVASVTRKSCAAYLSSFLARATCVPHAHVVHVLTQLTQFCHTFCSRSSGHAVAGGEPCAPRPLSRVSSLVLGPGQVAAGAQPAAAADAETASERDQVLFATVQGLLYALCYHLEPIMRAGHPAAGPMPPAGAAASQTAQAARSLVRDGVLTLVTHPLQPLCVCNPSVMAEFQRQVAVHGIADAQAIQVQHTPLTRTTKPVDMLFPFDPYLLRRSSRCLELPLSYVYWRAGRPQAGCHAALVQGDSEEEDDDDDEDTEAGAGTEAGGADPEDQDLELDYDSDDDDSSSSDTEDESLRGSSLRSDHQMEAAKPAHAIAKPAKRAHASHPKHGQAGLLGCPPVPGLPHHPQHAHAMGPRSGRSKFHKDSYDTLGASFSPGHMGDLTPSGTSPVIVEYMAGSLGRSASPMQMTPLMPSHMDMMPQRMAQAAWAGKRGLS